MSLQETEAFFERYRDAFNAGDGDAVADLWHTPSAISDSREGVARVTWWSEDAPMRANMRALCDVYRSAGGHRWSFDLIDHIELGTNHAFAQIGWTMHRLDGEVMQSFATGYQLLRTAAGPRALMCTAYQEEFSELKPHAAR